MGGIRGKEAETGELLARDLQQRGLCDPSIRTTACFLSQHQAVHFPGAAAGHVNGTPDNSSESNSQNGRSTKKQENKDGAFVRVIHEAQESECARLSFQTQGEEVLKLISLHILMEINRGEQNITNAVFFCVSSSYFTVVNDASLQRRLYSFPLASTPSSLYKKGLRSSTTSCRPAPEVSPRPRWFCSA